MSTETVKSLKAHVAIHVRDVSKSIEFYRKLFGIEPSKVRAGYAKFDVSNPPLNFTLNEGPVIEHGGLSHLGIQVESTADVLAVRQQWRERGLSTRDEMKTECCYALQDKTWVRDPDGKRMGSFCGSRRQSSRKAGYGKIVLRPGLLRACRSLKFEHLLERQSDE